MDDLLSEKEQIDQIRSWWSEYGAFVIGGIVIGAGVLFGINYYQSSKLEAQLAGSAAYETLVTHVSSGSLDDAERVANEILTSYGDTAYAGQAGLALARLYMDKNRDQDAADALSGVLDGKADDELKNIARLRLARIYLYQEKPEAVLELLANQDDEAFAAAYNDVLGDAYTELGRVVEAQDAYQKILMNPRSQGTVDPQLVQWKSLDLPAVEAKTAEPDAVHTVETDAVESEEVE